MKTVDFFIQQPHAEMLVRGLRNAIPDEHFSKGDRIYINATVPVLDLNAPQEHFQEVINHQLFGNLPPTDHLRYGNCIGFVEVLAHADGNESVWTKTSEPTVILTNARMFDKPQRIKPRKWYDAEDIPSHKFLAREPGRFYDELRVPVNEELYAIASRGGDITFELGGLLGVAVWTDDKFLRDFEKFTIVCGNRSKTFLWNMDCDIVWEQDADTDDLVLYPSVIDLTGKAPRPWLRLSCRYPLIG